MNKMLAAIAMGITLYPTIALSNNETEAICLEPDHLLSYPIDSSTILPTGLVTLNDQFITTPTSFTLVDAIRLLNPATKRHNQRTTNPQRPNTHYLSISLDDVDGIPNILRQTVQVYNQFDSHTFTIDEIAPTDLELDEGGDPILTLLVPSTKGACHNGNCTLENSLSCSDCFPGGDHYLCYDLDEEEAGVCSGNAIFRDQFVRNRGVNTLTPTRLCNPVTKTFNGVTDVPTFVETNHLLCYEINPLNISAKIVHLLNQFGQQDGVVTVNNEVCVPSAKVATLEDEIFPNLRAFVTSTTTTGSMVASANALVGDNTLLYNCSSDTYLGGTYVNDSGISGVNAADCLCRERASARNMICENGGFDCWKAWIADSNPLSQPASRFGMAILNSTRPINQVDIFGDPDPTAPLAVGGWADLVTCGTPFPDPENGIGAICLDDVLIGPPPLGPTMRNEFGLRGLGNIIVYTNVTPAGTVGGLSNCIDWSSNLLVPGAIGNAGSTTAGTDGWSLDTDAVDICGSSRPIYCFEDILTTLP